MASESEPGRRATRQASKRAQINIQLDMPAASTRLTAKSAKSTVSQELQASTSKKSSDRDESDLHTDPLLEAKVDLDKNTLVVNPTSASKVSQSKSKLKGKGQTGTEKKNNAPPVPAAPGQEVVEGNTAGIPKKKKIVMAQVVPKSGSDMEGQDQSVKSTIWEPPDWHDVLENIKLMRAAKDAPVDTMGCERTMEKNVEPEVRRYQTLVSLMLSSQTKDQVTYAAMDRLKAHGLTVQNILDTDTDTLGQLITPVGFWKKKAVYIKNATQILRETYGDDIPDTVEKLCSLPGVGPKMAHITMNVGWNQNTGIGVDTHVHRISNRLKWSGPKETKTPEKTREGLESWLPKEIWQEVNILLVGFGQTVCLPIGPKCNSCLNRNLCPFGKSELKQRKSPVKKKKVEIDYEDDVGETSKYF